MKIDFSKPVLVASGISEGTFLCMDGEGLSKSIGSGGGKVSCQDSCKEDTAKFLFHDQGDGTFTIESVQYPGIFLRMNGGGVRSFANNGTGEVNCQFGAGSWERFRLHEQEIPQGKMNQLISKGSLVTIESVAFPDVFLRMKKDEQGSGIVNCQYGAKEDETFYLFNPIDASSVGDLGNLGMQGI